MVVSGGVGGRGVMVIGVSFSCYGGGMVAPCLPSFLPSCNGIALRCVLVCCLGVLCWIIGK